MKKVFFKTAVLALVAVGISFQANAQQGTTKEEPVSFSQKKLIWKDSVIVMPEFDLQALLLEDSIKRKLDRDNRAGYAYDVNFNLENSGEWKTLENGDRIWHLVLACPDAKSINVYYDKFWMPEGAKFFVYGKDREHCRGAYTSVNNGKGKTRTNPRLFFTGPIYDDTIVLEYYEPKNVMNQGILSVSSLVHNYRFFDKDRWFNKKNSGGLNASGSCQVNINCEEGWRWQNEKNAVALFSIDGKEWGTGALINNTAEDKKLLFLTANHCLKGNGDAIYSPNCSTAVFFWHYESTNCSNPTIEPELLITRGATVLANDSVLDFALLELWVDPNDNPNIMTYYLAWEKSLFHLVIVQCV